MGIFKRRSGQTPSSSDSKNTNLVGSMVDKLGAKVDSEIALQKRMIAKTKIIQKHLPALERNSCLTAVSQAGMVLRDDEEILFAAVAKEADLDVGCVLVATVDRIFIAYNKTLNFAHTELLYSAIDRIDVGRNLRGAWINLWSNAQMIQLEKCTRDFEELQDIVRERQTAGAQDAATSPSQAAAVPSDLDTGMEQIKKLADLHAQGILSDEEFAAAKAKALGL